MSRVLTAAGLYNLAWAGLVIAAPLAPFRWAGMAEPNYPELWQCIGMIVGVYGVGYMIAASNPLRHWPIVFVGLLGKILGPIGFLHAALDGRLPWAAGVTILTNDLVWWVPFALILRATYVAAQAAEAQQIAAARSEFEQILAVTKTSSGATLAELSRERPTLVTFLRHSGCTFCREALADLAKARPKIEAGGAQLAFVHLGTAEEGTRFFTSYGLGDVPHVSDREGRLYRAFGLERGSPMQLLGPTVWWRGFLATVLGGHLVGLPVGDPLRMPGVFLVHQGKIIRAFRHATAADRPEYCELSRPPGQATSLSGVGA
jgi:peroxiredoxin